MTREEELEKALADLLDLVVLWQTGPLMSHITWLEYPLAQRKAMELLGRK